MHRFERGIMPHPLYRQDNISGSNPSEKAKGEYTMTPKRYQEMFGRPYMIRFSVPTITIQDGEPMVSIAEKTMTANDWRKMYDTEMQIPMITPTVRVSSTDGDKVNRYIFFVPTPKDSWDRPYGTTTVDNPQIIEGNDGFRYFEYRRKSRKTIADKQAGSRSRWWEVDVEEPSGVVLRWKKGMEIPYVEEARESHPFF